MSNPPHVHVIGAGLSGLSAALHLTMMGLRATLYEASLHAGGRCRSYLDRELECRIDNGNHLVLAGNAVMRDYLYFTGAEETIAGPGVPVFPFIDLGTGHYWNLKLHSGMVPWWIFSPRRRVPGTQLNDYLSIFKLMRAREDETVADLLGGYGMLYKRFWEPMTVAVLNTEAKHASARLLANVFAQSFAAGGKACVPLIPKIGLSETFVDPCLQKLKESGAEVKFGRRLRQFIMQGQKIIGLDFGDDKRDLGPNEWVVLAVPPWVATEILPEITGPGEFRSIINAHFRVNVPRNPSGFIGLIGGIAEWVFVKPGIASVTVSAAEKYIDLPAPELATLIWRDIAKVYKLNPDMIPPHRIVKEKRATFAATPAQNRKRPKAYTRWQNLVLAGDWTDTELPSTIEGSIRSGLKAAQVVARWSQ